MTGQNTRPTPSSDVAERVAYGDDGCLDEIVGAGVTHLERLDHDRWFLSIGSTDGSSLALWFTSKDLPDMFEHRPAALSASPAQVEVTDEMVERIVSFVEDKVAVVWARPGSRQYFADELRVALTAALTATDAKPVVPAEPVAWVDPDQISSLQDPFSGGEAGYPGTTLPARKTAGGRFTKPLYAAPPSPVEGDVGRLPSLNGLSLSVATALVEAFGGDETDMSLAFMRNGFGGPGFYSWLTEYPEDGCEFLGPVSEYSYLHFCLASEGKTDA